jgi:hypothetical protein
MSSKSRKNQPVVDPGNLLHGGAVASGAAGREEASRLQGLQGLESGSVGTQMPPVSDGRGGRHVVDPGQQSSQHLDLGVVELVGAAPAGAGPESVEDALHLAQAVAVGETKRSAHGDLLVAQREEQAVLLQNGLPAPAEGPVELGHQVSLLIELLIANPHVEDPILQCVEHQAVPSRLEAAGLHRGQHPVRGEAEEELALGHPGRLPAFPSPACASPRALRKSFSAL